MIYRLLAVALFPLCILSDLPLCLLQWILTGEAKFSPLDWWEHKSSEWLMGHAETARQERKS